MQAWNRYFHGEHAAIRAYLLTKLFLGMLALDAWMLMIGHAGRYGAGGFNVAHFDWLDRLQPVPTAPFYLGVLLLTGLVSLWLMLAGIQPVAMLVLFALYTFSWAMSMLDSYQHHYFVSLILLCMAFFPRVGARELLDATQKPLMRSGFGFPLLGTVVSIVYVYTAIAKMDQSWLDGHTIQTIPSARAGFDGLMRYAGRWGIEEARFWSLFATFVIPQELFMGAAYLVAIKRDTLRAAWVRWCCVLGFALVLALHVGAEHMGLEIGWFSYYMLTLGCCYLLPAPLLEWLARPLVWALATIDSLVREWEHETLPTGLLVGLSLGGASMLVGFGHMLDLPGALPAAAIAALALLALCAVAIAKRGAHDPRRHILSASVAGMAMWAAIAASDVRWDFYRYNGGDYFRRGELEASLEAYLKGERYAPEGESRMDKIKQVRRMLRRK